MRKVRIVKPLKAPADTLMIRWVSKKYGNFVYNKLYEARAKARSIKAPYVYADFYIKDEDGDYYTLDERDRGKLYYVLGGSN